MHDPGMLLISILCAQRGIFSLLSMEREPRASALEILA
jgi:hypothetical protein